MTNAIELIDLCKTFGQDEVLKHVTRSFEAGKIHGVVGNNGSGKTVMFKCICGFLQPTSGKVFVQGKQIGKDVDFPDDLGLIIETPGFLPQLSGLRNLEILASLKKRIGLKEVAAVIRRVGLDPLSTKPVGKYSLGMRQRLGIAQAIMEDPSLLILDEPMNGLDKHGYCAAGASRRAGCSEPERQPHRGPYTACGPLRIAHPVPGREPGGGPDAAV